MHSPHTLHMVMLALPPAAQEPLCTSRAALIISPLFAPVPPCVPFFGTGGIPSPCGRSKAPCRGRTAKLQYSLLDPGLGGEPRGRKWCRIKRCNHRHSHRPAMRVGDAMFSGISEVLQNRSERSGVKGMPGGI